MAAQNLGSNAFKFKDRTAGLPMTHSSPLGVMHPRGFFLQIPGRRVLHYAEKNIVSRFEQ
jgi:hypothetical protein